MKLSFLGPLYARPGPYASIYLDTSRDTDDDPDKAVGLRWRHLRDDLAAQGADSATVAALAGAVGSDREVPGRHGQALFAVDGRLALVEELPEPPVRDTARFAELPDAMPLAVQHAPDIPYAAVAVSRTGGEESGIPDADVGADLQAGRWPVSRAAPPARVHRRVAAPDWQHEASRIVDELAELVRRSGAEVIVVRATDPWTRGVLVNRIPERLHDRVIAVGDDTPAAGTGRALLEEDLSDVLRGQLSARDRARMDRYLAQRARHRDRSEGMAAVVAALQRGQAEALLLNRSAARLPLPLWVGPEPTQIALSAEELRFFGVLSAWAEPAGSALIRTLAGTGAELLVVPQDGPQLDGGVGVLLRYDMPSAL